VPELWLVCLVEIEERDVFEDANWFEVELKCRDCGVNEQVQQIV
jgi:hypothetical protein